MNTSSAYAFPSGTRYFSQNGTLFAHARDNHWYTVDQRGHLVRLNDAESAEGPGLVFTGDRIGKGEFLSALAEDERSELEAVR